MSDPKSRARVERILSGELRADDLANLFLYARDHCDGRETVKEVGDFVAHHTERTKGVLTRTARDWYAIVIFTAGPILGIGPRLDWTKLNEITPDYLWATLRRIDDKILKRDAKLSRAQAFKLLPEAIEKLHKNPDGTYALTSKHTHQEQALLERLCNILISGEAFTGERLFEEFVATLKSNGLISKEEIRSVPHLKEVVQLFAVAAMHRCKVRINDGTTMQLHAWPSEYGLSVMGGVEVEKKTMESPMFKTTLDHTGYFESELLKMKNWKDIDIELAPSGKLTKLG